MSNMRVRREAVKALENKFGRVSAEKLLEAAKDRRHPLHNDFEWDDSKAAHLHRLDQARLIIRSIRVVVTDATRKISTAGYLRDPTVAAHEQGYVGVTHLRNERDAAREALLHEATQLQAQLDRMREIASALDLGDALDAIVEAVMTLSTRLRRPVPAETEMRVPT